MDKPLCEAGGPWQYRSPGILRAPSLVSHSAGRAKDPPARDRYQLASRWFPRLLALEITTARRPAKDPRGHSPSSSRDERCQPPVGSATDSRRTAQAWDRRRPDHGRIYMARRRRPPSQGWKTFLRNHADGIASIDLLSPRFDFGCCMRFWSCGIRGGSSYGCPEGRTRARLANLGWASPSVRSGLNSRQGQWVAVGTRVASRPPHGSVRAPLCIRLLPWVFDGESLVWL
jgi:hypothetical protein